MTNTKGSPIKCHEISFSLFNMVTFDDMSWHVMMLSIWFREVELYTDRSSKPEMGQFRFGIGIDTVLSLMQSESEWNRPLIFQLELKSELELIFPRIHSAIYQFRCRPYMESRFRNRNRNRRHNFMLDFEALELGSELESKVLESSQHCSKLNNDYYRSHTFHMFEVFLCLPHNILAGIWQTPNTVSLRLRN